MASAFETITFADGLFNHPWKYISHSTLYHNFPIVFIRKYRPKIYALFIFT